MGFKQIRVKDLILVNHRGEVVEGTWPVNRAAFVIHSQINAARPDAVAAAHSPSISGKPWSTLRPPLAPPPPDPSAFYAKSEDGRVGKGGAITVTPRCSP